jgi:hypothetical protein
MESKDTVNIVDESQDSCHTLGTFQFEISLYESDCPSIF